METKLGSGDLIYLTCSCKVLINNPPKPTSTMRKEWIHFRGEVKRKIQEWAGGKQQNLTGIKNNSTFFFFLCPVIRCHFLLGLNQPFETDLENLLLSALTADRNLLAFLKGPQSHFMLINLLRFEGELLLQTCCSGNFTEGLFFFQTVTPVKSSANPTEVVHKSTIWQIGGSKVRSLINWWPTEVSAVVTGVEHSKQLCSNF